MTEQERQTAERLCNSSDFIKAANSFASYAHKEWVQGNDEQRTGLFEMIDRNVEQSKYNWALHELADQVDFFCEKIRLLADACGVTKHKEG